MRIHTIYLFRKHRLWCNRCGHSIEHRSRKKALKLMSRHRKGCTS